ncbi:MAG: hypothetical protein LBD01_02590 [Puniceicoccales bacterium]|jgi:hypothetical protein|nr:hypothetical protein [Puniceicoccales bacterium]
MKKSILCPALLIAAALLGQGCPEKKSEGHVADKCAASPPSPAAPAFVQEQSPEEHDPNADPVLGKWVCVTKDGETEEQKAERIAFLWPEAAGDRHAVGTLSFYNDYIASNGCCATAEWSLYAPKFYKAERGVHELYYMPELDKLYFLARVGADASEALFKKIIADIASQAPLETLHKDGALPALVEYKHVSNGKRF